MLSRAVLKRDSAYLPLTARENDARVREQVRASQQLHIGGEHRARGRALDVAHVADAAAVEEVGEAGVVAALTVMSPPPGVSARHT